MTTELSQTEAAVSATGGELDEFLQSLKQSFKPPKDESAAKEQNARVQDAISIFVDQALSNTDAVIKDDVLDTIERLIASIDEKLTAQLNEIIHAEEFQKIESAWRGLHHLVYSSETDATLKIRVLNISKTELYQHLKDYPKAKWDQSELFKRIYEEEYGQLGGQPYGALVGDYYFSHHPTDVQLLRDLCKIAAAAHAPFISAADPSLMRMDNWNELSNPRDIGKVFDTPEYAAWKSLRDSEDAKYLGLTLPRVLARLPYGANSEPVEEFGFEEDTDGHKGEKYAWMNSAYAMAANITRAFKEHGWCSRIRGVESGGEVEDLPTHTFPTDDGGVDLKCPTEIAISDRREAELAKAGLMPLIHRKNTDRAVFIGAQSLARPKEYNNDPDATASSNLAARLPYMFAVCRFAHYLKVMVRDKIGSTKEKEELQRWLQNWIVQYVDGDPTNSSDEVKRKKPLAGAKITIVPNEENPGYYSATFELRPHYQLEGMNIGMRLVSRLPIK
ncbi:type VI secretion system contractile sheath large subunit [Methylosinus sp. H3A]|uniref:type VI secretion system contractile sheath large subunit n=1 Tax=Methylosinus sp. H3A TaxID=2785786 RepID=UPI0018C2756C|nr:type VI secretion system contractile sheath large subunit [Methylosinus sp. H3A]MBG0809512.1 type VI secretion system contractile sheath large subunit [Methylosinus sp. H3A]